MIAIIQKTVLTFLVMLMVTFVHAQRPPQPPVSDTIYTPASLGYELFWKDDFTGNKLDTSKWEIRGLGKRALGYVAEKAVTVGDGYLTLHALQNKDSLFTGAVGSEHGFMTTYGYFECRAQLQQSRGQWGAFWLQSPKLSQGDDPTIHGAEIDIMECFRKLGDDIVSHNVHWGPYGAKQHTTHGMQSYLPGLGKGFHLFALEWTPEKYVFYVDGYKFYEVRDGVSGINQYIILSMELPNEAKDMNKAVLPDKFIIDYVKVYKKKKD